MTSFKKRKLKVSIKLSDDTKTNQPKTFSESGTDTFTIEDARISATIQNSGAPAGSMASVDIYGLTPSIMQQLSTLGMVFNIVPKNTITISAGDDEDGFSTVFIGTIMIGYANYKGAPNVPFHIEANAGLADATANAVATSYEGSTSVADLMGGFARQMGLRLENNGVDSKLSNAYFAGNIKTQMREAAEAAHINAEIVNGEILAIWPIGGSRDTQQIPLVSKDTGMIGYPAYTQQGIMVETLFDPTITFGGKIKVVSSVFSNIGGVAAVNDSGIWAVNQLNLTLESQVPHGEWKMTISAYNPNYPRPIPAQA